MKSRAQTKAERGLSNFSFLDAEELTEKDHRKRDVSEPIQVIIDCIS